MSSIWTLTYAGTTKTFDEWGFSALRRSLVSLDYDRVTFVHDGAAADGAPLFPAKAAIVIQRDGAPWFVGLRGRVTIAAEPGREGLQYEILGPWYYLDKCIFQQVWKVTNGVADTLIDASRSFVMLNQDDTGAKISTGDQITAALNYAISRGANLQIGSIGVDAMVPFGQARDLPCGEIIKNMLRWTPDAVGWFDHTTVDGGGHPCPTFHIVRRGDAEAVSAIVFPVDPADEHASALQLIPRDDLLVPAVVLKYNQVNTIDGIAYTEQTVEVAPGGGSDEEIGVFVADLQLQGFRESVQKQYVKTEEIDVTDVDWWKSRLPILRDSTNAAISGIVIDDGTLELSDEAIAAGYDADALSYQIVAGACPPWFVNFAFPCTARCNLSYVSEDGDGNKRIVGPTPVSINVIASRLAPGENTYTFLNVEEVAEEAPVGLAAEIYAALSALQYEGTIKDTQIEVPSAIGLGKNLNLTGGASAWATMNAQIQSITEDVDAGETSITIGPAKHLGGDDLLEQTRAARNWQPGAFRNERLTATPEGAAESTGVKDHKGEGYGAAPDVPKLSVKVGDHSLTIDLRSLVDLGTLATDITISPRTEQRAVVVGGVCTIKKVIILQSEPF